MEKRGNRKFTEKLGVFRFGSRLRISGNVFFGWWMALATGIIYFWCYGIWSYGFGAYFEPLTSEFSWTRAQISGAISVRMAADGTVGAFVGLLIDKYGPRVASFAGILCSGLGLVLLYFLNSILEWWLIWGLIISLGFNVSCWHALESGLAKWFVKKRGTAAGLARFLMGVGGLALPPLMTLLLSIYGLRIFFVIAGIMTWALCLPLIWFFVRSRRPEYYELMPDGEIHDVAPKEDEQDASMTRIGQEYAAEFGEVEFTLRQALRTKAFWVIAVSTILVAPVFPLVSVHGIPHFIDIGVDPMTAATTIGFAFFIGAPLRFIGGWVTDHINLQKLKYLWMLAYGFEAFGFLILIRASSLPLVYMFIILWGVGFGLMHSIRTPLLGRYFGRKGFATINGVMSTIAMPARVIAPMYIGWVHDVTGSYVSTIIQTLVMVVLSIAIMFVFLRPPKEKPEVLSDISKIV